MNSKGKSKMPEWREFYSLSRGIESVLPDVDNALAGKSHPPAFSTTTAHYIKSVEAAATRAVDKISELFDNASGFGRPSQQRAKMNLRLRLTKRRKQAWSASLRIM
jgi:predicted trehalose synthase